MYQRVPFTGGEKQSLKVALDRHRDAILWKMDGLDDEQLKRMVLPSGLTLLTLLKHLAAVEYSWFCETFGRPAEPVLGYTANDEPVDDADFRIEPGQTSADIYAYYARARAAADSAIDEIDLDDTGTAWFGDAVSMRWVLIHMLEEVARHAGHADVIRELIDGFTGDFNRDDE